MRAEIQRESLRAYPRIKGLAYEEESETAIVLGQAREGDGTMSQIIYCDMCGGDITGGVRSIHESFHPQLDKTPKFRISIEFYQQFSSNKADLCRPCMIVLAKEKIADIFA